MLDFGNLLDLSISAYDTKGGGGDMSSSKFRMLPLNRKSSIPAIFSLLLFQNFHFCVYTKYTGMTADNNNKLENKDILDLTYKPESLI